MGRDLATRFELFEEQEIIEHFNKITDVHSNLPSRGYDPGIGRFTGVDLLSYRRHWITPYNYVQNNPIIRIDRFGLTDFKINKETGEVTQVEEENDNKDRLLKTDSEGNVKRKGDGLFGFLVSKSERGKAKVAVGGIEKGILEDGQNFKKDDQIIDVNGEGKPSLNGEDFVTELGEYVGVEMSGAYLTEGNDAQISKVYIDEYKGNTPRFASTSLTKLHTAESIKGMNPTTHFHTHLTNIGASRPAIENASPQDLEYKEGTSGHFINYLILTRGKYSNDVQRITYYINRNLWVVILI